MEKTFELSYKIKFRYSGENLTEEIARKTAVKELMENHNIEARPRELKNEFESVDITWFLEDVKRIRDDLNDEQAHEVLLEVLDNHDAEYGVSWDTLKDRADILFSKDESRETL